MLVGTCRLCLLHRSLCDSHALPDSLFNYILRKNSGKAIVITDDATTPVQYSADTWETELLCQQCEQLLNRLYDAYGMAVFRGQEGGVLRASEGVLLLRIDRRRLRMFFLSVLWRISVSTHHSYSNIELPAQWEEELRTALLAGRSLPQGKYTVAVYKMRDTTPKGGFSNEALRSFIAAPFARRFDGFISVCYPFLGFFVETFLPRVPEKYAKRPGVIHGRSPVFLAPYVEVLDVPEIMSMLVRALGKHRDGLSRVG